MEFVPLIEIEHCPACGSAIPAGGPASVCPRCMLAGGLVDLEATLSRGAFGPWEGEGDLPALDGMSGVREAPGRYGHVREHGRGGMGRVLLVHDAVLGRDVALKELAPDLGLDHADPSTPVRHSMSLLSRFLREARITGQLEHPSIVPVYELGHREDGTLYYTMKLVRGRTLRQAIVACHSLQERLGLLPHFIDLCQAIAYAHSRGVIHRDIKPDNVMVGEFGETVVLDWGLAKQRDRDGEREEEVTEGLRAMRLGGEASANWTAHGQVMGTPAYMAPEQARGELDALDEQSDVYSLGVVLFEILAGRVPFEGKNFRAVLDQVTDGRPAPVNRYEKNAPPELIAIAAKAMKKEKAHRYATAKALADEVQRFQSGAMVHAHNYDLADYSRFVWNRHRALITIAVVALILVAAITSLFLTRLSISNREAVAARERADAARIDSETAKEEAITARERENELRIRAEREAYAANVRLTQAVVERGDAQLARMQLIGLPEIYRNWEWGYLYRTLDQSSTTLIGPIPLVSAVFSPDGMQIAEGLPDGGVQLWNLRKGSEGNRLRGSGGPTHALAFSHDSVRVAGGTEDGTVAVWDARSGTEGFRMRTHSAKISRVLFSSDGRYLVSASEDGTAIVWSPDTGERLMVLMGHDAAITDAAFSPDSTTVVTTSADRTARVWDMDTGEERYVLLGHTDGLSKVTFSPNGTQIVTGSKDRTGRIWNAGTGAFEVALEGHLEVLLDITYSADGSRIATGSFDDTARIWDAHTGEQLAVLGGHSGMVNAVDFSPDGSRVVTASFDRTVRVWDAETGKLDVILGGHKQNVRYVAFSPDGEYVRSVSLDNTIKVWEVEALLHSHDEWRENDNVMIFKSIGLTSACFSPDGARVVSGSTSGTAIVWDAHSGEVLLLLPGHSGYVMFAEFSVDGSRIVTASRDKTARVWDARTGEELLVLRGHTDWLETASFSPDGKRIVTASLEDQTARVWDAESGKELITLPVGTRYETTARFSPDSKRVVTCYGWRDAAVWDASSGERLLTLVGHGNYIADAAYSPDGTRIVTASEDRSIKVWDAVNGAQLLTLRGHENGTYQVSFSPDGTRILSGSWDKTAKVWDATTGAELVTLRGHTHGIFAASFSPDGTRIITASADSTARIWKAAPWHGDDWNDPEGGEVLIPLALRHTEYRQWPIEVGTPEFDVAVEQLDALSDALGTKQAGDKRFEILEEQGLFATEAFPLTGPGLYLAEASDLIRRINGKRVDSPTQAASILRDFASSLKSQATSLHILALDVVRPYGHEIREYYFGKEPESAHAYYDHWWYWNR